MARRRKGLTGAPLRAFRRDVSIAKRKGIISPKIDARKQRPTRYMRRRVRDFADVISGKLAPSVPVSPKVAEIYRKGGFQVARRRVILEPDIARRAKPSKENQGLLSTKDYVVGEDLINATVLERVIMPVGVNTWTAFKEFLLTSNFDKMKRPQDVWAFTFMGNPSRERGHKDKNGYHVPGPMKTFKNSDALYEWMQHYDSIEDYPGLTWNHFILYRVYPPGTWEELGGGVTYDVRQFLKRKRRSRAKLDHRGRDRSLGEKAKLTYQEVKAREKARKAIYNKTPERKESMRNYMRKRRLREAKEEGRTIRKYRKTDK